MRTRARRLAVSAIACVVIASLGPTAAGAYPFGAVARSPQVPVSGSALQQLLDQGDGYIQVTSDQLDGGLARSVTDGIHTGVAYTIELVATDGTPSGIYDGHAATPTLMPVFPDSARTGWFAAVGFFSNPPRTHIVVFDELNELRGQTTYPGADPNGMGLYVSGPGGTLYSQDARNPGAAAQVLCFAGTGINTGSLWVAAEDRPLRSNPDADYADVVWRVLGGEYSYVTPVQHVSWGQVKSRFR
jgi:hypothetical protein